MQTAELAAPRMPQGEIRGSMLMGLVRAFRNIRLISGDSAADMVDGVDSFAWYPMAQFFRVLEEVCRRDVDYGPILFNAGAAVSEDWYLNGGGRQSVSSAMDFLRFQGNSGGYRSVHRGDPEHIGWMDLVELDEAAGRAVIVTVTPYPREFERGILFGGTLMAGDTEFVHVESVEEPYNDHLSKKTLTVRFRRIPDQATRGALDALLKDLAPDRPVAPSARLFEAMAWRLKGVEELRRVDALFHQSSSLLLERAMQEVYQLSQKLDRLAHRDELTGLLNRRAAIERAEGMLALGERHGRPTAFVMIDIDHFKSINDRWGHAFGDTALRLVAAELQSRVRDSDLLGRIGGEEFLAILPDTDIEGARVVAESLRIAIANQTLQTPDRRRVPLTISLGLALAMGTSGSDVGEFIRQADDALYRSKQSGRNRVTCFMH